MQAVVSPEGLASPRCCKTSVPVLGVTPEGEDEPPKVNVRRECLAALTRLCPGLASAPLAILLAPRAGEMLLRQFDWTAALARHSPTIPWPRGLRASEAFLSQPDGRRNTRGKRHVDPPGLSCLVDFT